MVQVFRAVHRVLRDDGTCWVNMGDSYAVSGRGGNPGLNGNEKQRSNEGSLSVRGRRSNLAKSGPLKGGCSTWDSRDVTIRNSFSGLKPKDLIGMPWRLALALQADGWYLRCDIIWHKPNPMPESCTDRPTKSHEYIFLLSKSEHYFYDGESIREPVTGTKLKMPDGWDTGIGGHGSFHRNGRGKTPGKNSRIFVNRDASHPHPKNIKQNESFSAAVSGLVSSRNKRSVWTVSTAPFREAHFATFPADLIKPCIIAGSSSGGSCINCLAPLERVVEFGDPDTDHQRACGGDFNGEYHGKSTKDYAGAKAQNASETKARILRGMTERKTVGWVPTCKCDCNDTVPCTVLDPFAGSGTTGQVAIELGRKALLIELNPDYIKLIERRCDVTPGLPIA